MNRLLSFSCALLFGLCSLTYTHATCPVDMFDFDLFDGRTSANLQLQLTSPYAPLSLPPSTGVDFDWSIFQKDYSSEDAWMTLDTNHPQYAYYTTGEYVFNARINTQRDGLMLHTVNRDRLTRFPSTNPLSSFNKNEDCVAPTTHFDSPSLIADPDSDVYFRIWMYHDVLKNGSHSYYLVNNKNTRYPPVISAFNANLASINVQNGGLGVNTEYFTMLLSAILAPSQATAEATQMGLGLTSLSKVWRNKTWKNASMLERGLVGQKQFEGSFYFQQRGATNKISNVKKITTLVTRPVIYFAGESASGSVLSQGTTGYNIFSGSYYGNTLATGVPMSSGFVTQLTDVKILTDSDGKEASVGSNGAIHTNRNNSHDVIDVNPANVRYSILRGGVVVAGGKYLQKSAFIAHLSSLAKGEYIIQYDYFATDSSFSSGSAGTTSSEDFAQIDLATYVNSGSSIAENAIFAEPITRKVMLTHTLSFEEDGGTLVVDQNVAHNATGSVPTPPTKSGFIFDGWYTDNRLVSVFDFSTPMRASKTVYARWIPFVDTDGDGVADRYDLDNDNDGILDSVECPTSLRTFDWGDYTWNPGVLSNSYVSSGKNFSFSVVDRYGALSPLTPTIYPFYKGDQPTIGSGLNIAVNLSRLVRAGTSPRRFNTTTVTMNLGDAGTGLHDVAFKLFDVDGERGRFYRREWYKITGYIGGTKILPRLIGTDNHRMMWRSDKISGLNPVDPDGDGSDGLDPVKGVVQVSFSGAVDTVEIEFGFIQNSRVVSSSRPGYGISNITYVEHCDTDADGIPNYFDADSDNDGCFDALEGAGSLSMGQVTGSGSIVGSVDASGVPLLVGSGQAMGSSQEAGKVTIATHPKNQTINVGQQVNFSVQASASKTTAFSGSVPNYNLGTGDVVFYQWQVSVDGGSTWSNILGSTGALLTLAGVSTDMNNNHYRVIVSCAMNAACGVASDVAVLSVNNTTTQEVTGSSGRGSSGGDRTGSVTTTPAHTPTITPTTTYNNIDPSIFNESFSTHTCFNPLDEETIYQWNDVTAYFRTAHQMFYSYKLTKWRGTLDYGPKLTLTREQAARFMVEFAINVLCRKPTYVYTNQFSDIEGADPTLLPFIKQSYEYVIFHGDSGGASKGKQTTFRPKDVISYDELVAVMIRLVTNEYNEAPGEDRAKHYRSFLYDRVNTELSSVTIRDNVAEVIYDLYKLNNYDWKNVGYVIDKYSYHYGAGKKPAE